MNYRVVVCPVAANLIDNYFPVLQLDESRRPFSGMSITGWDTIACDLPRKLHRDFIAAWLPHHPISPRVWTAPVPIIGLAADWNLHWHHYVNCLPHCDLVLTDALGVDAFRQAGFDHVRPADLHGLRKPFFDLIDQPDVDRDIDILFVGNPERPLQAEMLPWLARLARLADRCRVVIRTNVAVDEYRNLLRRSRIVFNRGDHGECNSRTFEALAAGALLFQECESREVPGLLQPDREYVPYFAGNLEAKLEHHLTHETERAAIAAAGRARVKEFSFEAFWEQALDVIEAEWPRLQERAARRVAAAAPFGWTARAWQHVSVSRDLRDPAFAADVRSAKDAETLDADGWYALGLSADNPAEAAAAFAEVERRAPNHLLADLARAEALRAAGQSAAAIEQARRLLAALDVANPVGLDVPPYIPDGHRLRVEWERAGWENAGEPERELRTKLVLLRWRANAVLAELTGDLGHFQQAVAARPDIPQTQAALGCALARAGKFQDALRPLRQAVADQPFDRAAARALGQLLADLGDHAGRDELVRDRRRLARAVPQLAPPEPWFADRTTPAPAKPSLTAAAEPGDLPTVAWEGNFHAVYSLAIVNRAICLGLESRGIPLAIRPTDRKSDGAMPAPLKRCLERRLPQADVCVRHGWPPRLEPPPAGRWVMMQPWEYGSLPTDWATAARDGADEVWVYSRAVRDCYVSAGVPADRVHVIPLGVDPAIYRPDAQPYLFPGPKRFRILFVGGTLRRKGIDLLLEAFAQEFRPDEPVTLVIKGMGGRSFYHGQTAERLIATYRDRGLSIEEIDHDLTEAELAGLYVGCDCLAHPYRGEGFALPVAEAMACGLPVIVTAGGATDDFCDDATAYRVAAQKTYFPENRIGQLATVGRPWLLEPSLASLRASLRAVVQNPDQARAKGRAASDVIRRRFTWAHTAQAVENRLRHLSGRPIRRQPRTFTSVGSARASAARRMPVSLCMIVKNEEQNLPACLDSVKDLVGEMVVVDTGSTDRTKEVAAGFGAKVVNFAWCDDFAAARNESVEQATGDWVFWLDADERLDAANRNRLRAVFDSLRDERAAYLMRQLSRPAERGGSPTAVDQVRLFRRLPELRWEYRVHEQIMPAVRRAGATVRETDVVIDHGGYVAPDLRDEKLRRNMRLLEIAHAERPEEPILAFNLAWIFQKLNRPTEALPLLTQCLTKVPPRSSVMPKLYRVLGQVYEQLGRGEQAMATYREGGTRYPHHPELALQEGLLRRKHGDLAGAETCLRRVLETPATACLTGLDLGMRGFKTRHVLADLLASQKQFVKAREEWTLAVREQPEFIPGWMGLARIALEEKSWSDFDDAVSGLEKIPGGARLAAAVRARRPVP
jgi:glycosyltransferase involved in cell wall biosynthesis/tetratricopeptide (TPR) repeat protein